MVVNKIIPSMLTILPRDENDESRSYAGHV